jgi:hypothetical protein
MRVSNTQFAELDDIIEKIGLHISFFDRIREDNECGYKFKSDYYIFTVLKRNDGNYLITLNNIEQRDPYQVACHWEDTIHRFEDWVKSIKGEIKAEEKINMKPKSIQNKEFPTYIRKFSPKFCHIYNQAYKAEQYDLEEICGLGFRKSFEFLIKDYVIINKSKDEVKKIKDMQIMQCINTFVNDDKVKALAHRVLWLGNDHAHYTKIWTNKSIEDLKNLINITIDWIDAHQQLINIHKKMEKVEKSMPPRNKKP